MLRRKITAVLEDWKKNGSSTALNIIGARQVGKSTAVREFGQQHYDAFIEINFINSPQAREIFRDVNSVEDILTNLTAFSRKTITPGNTLILLDEIQEAPEARTAIKFLVEDGRADYIETGSLLGVKIQEIRSYPVGFEQIIPMYPMDFEEFLWACRVPEATISFLHDCFENRKPIPSVIHQSMLRLFYTWMVVGGMPEAVQAYVDTNDIAIVSGIKERLIDLYRSDISKYTSPSSKVRILEIFDAIPGQLDQKNRRFLFTDIKKGLRFRQLESSFLWLSEAGISLPCLNTSAPVYPLRINEKRSLFKLYLFDTGILCQMISPEIHFDILKGNTEINTGSVLENAFAQSLRSKNLSLYYFDNKKIELDFITEQAGKIDLLEIKSGNDYYRHTALNNAIKTDEWNIHQAIVFCKGNLEKRDNVLYLPFYMVMFYAERKAQESTLVPIELSGLLL